jgi:hypothetical protein
VGIVHQLWRGKLLAGVRRGFNGDCQKFTRNQPNIHNASFCLDAADWEPLKNR